MGMCCGLLLLHISGCNSKITIAVFCFMGAYLNFEIFNRQAITNANERFDEIEQKCKP